MHGIPRAALNGSYAHAALTIGGSVGSGGHVLHSACPSMHFRHVPPPTPVCSGILRVPLLYFLFFLYLCQCEAFRIRRAEPHRACTPAVRSRYHVLGRAEVSVASLSDGTWCPWNTAWGRIDMEKPGAQVYCPAYRASTHAPVGARVL